MQTLHREQRGNHSHGARAKCQRQAWAPFAVLLVLGALCTGAHACSYSMSRCCPQLLRGPVATARHLLLADIRSSSLGAFATCAEPRSLATPHLAPSTGALGAARPAGRSGLGRAFGDASELRHAPRTHRLLLSAENDEARPPGPFPDMTVPLAVGRAARRERAPGRREWRRLCSCARGSFVSVTCGASLPGSRPPPQLPAQGTLHIESEAPHRAFTDSAYYQKYEPGPKFETTDVSAEPELRRMLDKVAYKNETIMFAFNAADVWLDFAAAMVYQLRAVGYLHFFAIATRSCCEQLHARHPDAPCVSFELPGSHWRNEQGVTHLWIGRYKLANSIARMGVNILVVDLDTIFRRDVYADLKAEPLAGASLIHMEEGFANGGLFYIHNPVPNGPALWTHDEARPPAALPPSLAPPARARNALRP